MHQAPTNAGKRDPSSHPVHWNLEPISHGLDIHFFLTLKTLCSIRFCHLSTSVAELGEKPRGVQTISVAAWRRLSQSSLNVRGGLLCLRVPWGLGLRSVVRSSPWSWLCGCALNFWVVKFELFSIYDGI